MNKKCEKSVRKNPFLPASTPCGKTAKVWHDDKWYCGIHDPEGKAAKAREARSQMAQEKFDARSLRSRLDHNRLEVFSEMLAALEVLAKRNCVGCGIGWPLEESWHYEPNGDQRSMGCQALEAARIIAKAKGE